MQLNYLVENWSHNSAIHLNQFDLEKFGLKNYIAKILLSQKLPNWSLHTFQTMNISSAHSR